MIVHVANLCFLAILLIGLPAAASQRVGPYRLSEDPTLRWLIFAGLGTATAINVLASLFAPGKKTRHRCRRWFVAHLVLLLFQWLLLTGMIDFSWLKRFLRWVQKTFGG